MRDTKNSEMRAKFLNTFTPEERVIDLPPEQRLIGLSPEQQILALSDEVLRGFSDEYLRALPPSVRDAVYKRLARA